MNVLAALPTLLLAASGSITFQSSLVESMAVDLKVVPNSLPSTLMTNNLFNDMAVVDESKARRRGKEAYLSAESIHKIKETMGILPVSSPEGMFVATTKIKKTTQRHTDYYTDAQGVIRPAEKPTVFVFMNDNPDAFFHYGETSVPVKKGSLVRFNGLQPHNTVIGSGTVELLGPFEGDWLSAIGAFEGDTCATDDQCLGDLLCVNGVCCGSSSPSK